MPTVRALQSIQRATPNIFIAKQAHNLKIYQNRKNIPKPNSDNNQLAQKTKISRRLKIFGHNSPQPLKSKKSIRVNQCGEDVQVSPDVKFCSEESNKTLQRNFNQEIIEKDNNKNNAKNFFNDVRKQLNFETEQNNNFIHSIQNSKRDSSGNKDRIIMQNTLSDKECGKIKLSKIQQFKNIAKKNNNISASRKNGEAQKIFNRPFSPLSKVIQKKVKCEADSQIHNKIKKQLNYKAKKLHLNSRLVKHHKIILSNDEVASSQLKKRDTMTPQIQRKNSYDSDQIDEPDQQQDNDVDDDDDEASNIQQEGMLGVNKKYSPKKKIMSQLFTKSKSSINKEDNQKHQMYNILLQNNQLDKNSYTNRNFDNNVDQTSNNDTNREFPSNQRNYFLLRKSRNIAQFEQQSKKELFDLYSVDFQDEQNIIEQDEKKRQEKYLTRPPKFSKVKNSPDARIFKTANTNYENIMRNKSHMSEEQCQQNLKEQEKHQPQVRKEINTSKTVCHRKNQNTGRLLNFLKNQKNTRQFFFQQQEKQQIDQKYLDQQFDEVEARDSKQLQSQNVNTSIPAKHTDIEKKRAKSPFQSQKNLRVHSLSENDYDYHDQDNFKLREEANYNLSNYDSQLQELKNFSVTRTLDFKSQSTKQFVKQECSSISPDTKVNQIKENKYYSNYLQIKPSLKNINCIMITSLTKHYQLLYFLFLQAMNSDDTQAKEMLQYISRKKQNSTKSVIVDDACHLLTMIQ